MKIMTFLGTRPEIIRLSLIIPKLDALCDHIVIHTGQNFDPTLSDIFLEQLGMRQPDSYLGIRERTFGEQIGRILAGAQDVLEQHQPDGVLILGDTNSGLAAIIAKRLGIPVFHMEAGNRCYDDRVPEEANRRIIDHCSDVLMPYTERSRLNLLREGIAGQRVYVTGNPIFEVIRHFEDRIGQSAILTNLGLESGKYFLVTMHRAENVDVEGRLRGLTSALEMLHRQYEMSVVVSTHPHTRGRMEALGLGPGIDQIRYLSPFGLFDFITLERNAFCVLSDSGTVQEECCIFEVPNVTIRDVTERPETLECGSNILSGADPETILRCVQTVVSSEARWTPPKEYLEENVSRTVVKIVTGYHRLADV